MLQASVGPRGGGVVKPIAVTFYEFEMAVPLLKKWGVRVGDTAASFARIDTTGAGDSFLGAFAFAKSAGLPALAAVRAASVVAARSVQGRGAQPSYASAADLDLDALPAVEAIPSGASGLFTLRTDGTIAGR